MALTDSALKVDRPAATSELTSMWVWISENGVISRRRAGAMPKVCAINTATAMPSMLVDFPAALGPVIIVFSGWCDPISMLLATAISEEICGFQNWESRKYGVV